MKYINKKVVLYLFLAGLAACFILANNLLKNNKAEEVTSDAATADIITLSSDVIKNSGISSITVYEKPLISEITTSGAIKANEDRRFTINSTIIGRIVKDFVKLGDFVRQGQTVAIVQNPEVTKIHATSTQQLHENEIVIRQAKTRYSLAKLNYDREKKLYNEGISPGKDYIQAQADLAIAKAELENAREKTIHIRSEAKAMLGTYGVNSNLSSEKLITNSPITAMSSGVITKKNITLGAMVSPDLILYEVSDFGQLWLDMTIYSKDVAKIKEGQTVVFKPDSLPSMEFVGKINYIQPSSDEPTQTFLARAFINNPKNLLKPGMFGEISINSNLSQIKPFVSNEAIQKYGKEYFVFLDLGNGKYKKQVITLGERMPDGYFINSGVNTGDRIVGSGSFTLKSELLKSEFAEEE